MQRKKRRKIGNTKQKIVLSILICLALILWMNEPGRDREALAVSSVTQPINMMYSFMLGSNIGQIDQMTNRMSYFLLSLNPNALDRGQERPANETSQVSNKANENSNHAVNAQKAADKDDTDQTIDLKKIYLTFDDGPSAVTGSIVDMLNAYDMKATFFMLEPNMKQYPKELKQLVKDGHIPALHGVTHNAQKIYRSEKTVVAEMVQGQKTLEEITGAVTYLIRTPYGSAPYMKPSYKQAVASAGFQLWDWTIDSEDWKYYNGEFVDHVIHQIENYKYHDRPIIILLHDRQATADYLETLLAYIKSQGYETEVLHDKLTAYHF